MENWCYLGLNKNENLFNLKASGHPHYVMKSISLNELKTPHYILIKNDSLTLGTEALIQKHSWRIHLSIYPQDLPQAWDMIFPILAKHRIDMFKVANFAAIDKGIKEADEILLAFALNKTKETSNEVSRQKYDEAKLLKDELARIKEGSQITIFTIPGLEEQYRLVLNEIENVLQKNSIRTGKFNGIDRVIGIYTSVRYMMGSDATAKLIKSYNPENVLDPFYSLDQIQFINEIRMIAKDKDIKSKRKLTKTFMLDQFKIINNILVLQDIFRFLRSKDADFLRRKPKIKIFPFNTEQSIALRKILKVLKNRVLIIAKTQQVISAIEDTAIKEILGFKRNEPSNYPRWMRKYEKLQKKGLIKIFGENHQVL